MQDIGSAVFETNTDKRRAITNKTNTITRFVIFSFICLVLSAALPLTALGAESTSFSALSIPLIAGAVIVYTSRRLSSIIIAVIAYLFVMSFTGSPVIPALIVSAIVLCGIYSALISETSMPATTVTVALVPILSFAVSFVLTGELLISLLPIAAFLPSIAMGIAARSKCGRTAAISVFAAVSAAEVILISTVHIYLQNGALSLELVQGSADYLQAQIISALENAVIRAGNVPLGDDIISEIRLLSEELINCLCGITAVLLLTAGYLAQSIQHSFFERIGLEELQNRSGEQIQASLMSALVFIIAHICSFATGASNNSSVFSAAAMNISLILLPLMLSVGVGFLLSLPQKIGFLAIVIWIGAVALSVMLSSSVISVLALIGSFYTIAMCVDVWAKEHYSKGEDQ